MSLKITSQETGLINSGYAYPNSKYRHNTVNKASNVAQQFCGTVSNTENYIEVKPIAGEPITTIELHVQLFEIYFTSKS